MLGFGEHGINFKGSIQMGINDISTDIKGLIGAPGSFGTDLFEIGDYLLHGNLSKGFEKLVLNSLESVLKGFREYT